MNSKQFLGNLALVTASLLWGSTFVAQSVASGLVRPFTFLASRSLFGFLFLLLLSIVLDLKKGVRKTIKTKEKLNLKPLLVGGLACGIVLTLSSSLQQFGMSDSNSGKAGFITAMYILLVPIFGLFIGKKVSAKVWISVVLGVLGLYFLCINSGFTLETTDIFLILCAVSFSLHILVVDHFSPKVDSVKLSCIQFLVVFLLASILAFIFETPTISGIISAILPILYAGIMSSGIAFTLQIVGQKHTPPAIASLLMSLESVFGVLSSIVVLGIFPTSREWIGSFIMLIAIILSQLPKKVKNR